MRAWNLLQQSSILHIMLACAGKVMHLVWIAYGSGMDEAAIPFRDSWGLLPRIMEHTSCAYFLNIVESWIEHE